MKFADLKDYSEVFGDVSTEGLQRFYIKEGYIVKLVDPAPFGIPDHDTIDIIEIDDFNDCVEFTTQLGNTHRVDVEDSFALTVYEVKERMRFLKDNG